METTKSYAILYDQHSKPRFILPVLGFVVCPTSYDTIYLEFASDAPQPVNAMWAHLRKNWRTSNLATTNIKIYNEGKSDHVHIIPKVKRHYGSKNGNHFMIHEGFDRLHLTYLLKGTEAEPSPWFNQAMQRFIEVPYLSRWSTPVWVNAISEKLIVKCDGWGLPCWKMKRNQAEWQKLITDLVKEGVLT